MSYGYAEADPGTGGPKFATDDIGGVQTPISKVAFGAEGTATPVSTTNGLPVVVMESPLPTGAASEATLAAIDAKLPALSGGRIPVEMPAGGGGLTDAELRASPVPVEDGNAGNLLWRILQMLMAPLGFDKSLQRQRGTVIVESGTVTTLTNQTNIGGFNAEAQVRANINAAWALNVRARIT